MPEIQTGAQIFDIAFHPSESTVFVGLLTGGVKAYRYDEQGQSEEMFSVMPSKRSCRSLATTEDGSELFAVGKGKAMYTLDTATGKVANSRLGIHQAPINRIKRLTPHLLTTGDDDGVVKVRQRFRSIKDPILKYSFNHAQLWDPRKPETLRSYTHHFDFISDFMWIEGKKQLVVTSGDGTLSVIDVRSSKPGPLAHSEDQEDEMLSVVPIRGGEKTIVGTQLGVLAVFNRSSGWGDCVDRVPGHPHSIDALCALPPTYSSAHSTILTGSSDGLLRAVQLFPTKLLGVVTDHGAFPIERVAIDRNGTGTWVGSVGHDEMLRMTDLKEVFEDEDGDEEEKEDESGNDDGSEDENKVENETGDDDASSSETVEDAKISDIGEGESDEEQSPSKGKAKETNSNSDDDSGDTSDAEPQNKKKKTEKQSRGCFRDGQEEKAKGEERRSCCGPVILRRLMTLLFSMFVSGPLWPACKTAIELARRH
ncbi:hypothetical protein EW145_g2466 [Phellinidium pouzarii]|uniref:WD repeat-containing protein JIP5 n=1 Tax=Phellinidium pouzarii TaxID=167371 RepID=A0A4S4LAR3_9AGAM|nr:hypothetical protein EW145_g2466 [Phellinidium pouzarii]